MQFAFVLGEQRNIKTGASISFDSMSGSDRLRHLQLSHLCDAARDGLFYDLRFFDCGCFVNFGDKLDLFNNSVRGKFAGGGFRRDWLSRLLGADHEASGSTASALLRRFPKAPTR